MRVFKLFNLPPERPACVTPWTPNGYAVGEALANVGVAVTLSSSLSCAHPVCDTAPHPWPGRSRVSDVHEAEVHCLREGCK
jgi:hypothetical protein